MANIPKYVKKASVYTVFILGSVHVILSYIGALVTGNYEHINYFHILAIDLFFPELAYGLRNTLLSQVFLVFPIVLMAVFYHREKKSKKY